MVQITITPDKGVLASLTWNMLVQEFNRKHGHHDSRGMLMKRSGKTGSNKCEGAPRLNPIGEGDGYSKGVRKSVSTK